VLTALREHPALQKIKISSAPYGCPPNLSGLEVLLRCQDSKIKELVLERMTTRTVGLHSVIRELGRNTTNTKLAISDSLLSRENLQQLKSMLRRNNPLESLDLTRSALGSAGLAEIASVLYRNTSIKSLDLSDIGLHDIESANVLRELIRLVATRRLQAFVLLVMPLVAMLPLFGALRMVCVAIQPYSSLI
jgi:Ran GTPase-activating protein (RanGAP) involved in mRNA processing and transport